uniref:Uncharacterized protein n=1 Tax=Anguilla anguilla TaxID=7936 RepID=A0A0E9WPZ0_ANGAN
MTQSPQTRRTRFNKAEYYKREDDALICSVTVLLLPGAWE